MLEYKKFSEARRQKKLQLKARTQRLYDDGLSIRQVAILVGMSHGWVGYVVKKRNEKNSKEVIHS